MPPLVLASAFYRAHGLGNDYLVFEATAGERGGWRPSADAIRKVCDRWWGLGSDGIVVLVDPDATERFPLRMFNPDGSEFERSGNGLRILGSHLRRTGRVGSGPFTVVSGGSSIGMQVHDRTPGGIYDVSVEMGRARIGAEDVELDSARMENGSARLRHPELGPVAFLPVSVGNPHAVVPSDDLSDELLSIAGPFLATHAAFARGTNVQLAQFLGPDEVRIAIWERGVGRTSASGTSSCAVAVAGVHLGLLEPGDVTVRMEGGVLRVHVTAELDVTLRGPVQEVAAGELAPGFLATLV